MNEIHSPSQHAQNDTHWRFSRTLSLDSILAVGAAAIAVIFFGTTLDKRLTVIEAKYDELKAQVKQTEESNKERFVRLEQTLRDQSTLIQSVLTQPRR